MSFRPPRFTPWLCWSLLRLDLPASLHGRSTRFGVSEARATFRRLDVDLFGAKLTGQGDMHSRGAGIRESPPGVLLRSTPQLLSLFVACTL